MAEGTRIAPRPKRKSIDLATIVGMVCGFALVATAIFFGGDPKSFFNLPAIAIVIGGTTAVVTMCFSLKEIGQTVQVVSNTFVYTSRDASEAANHVLEIAELARRNGVLALQGIVDSLSNEPFLHKGVSLVVDGRSEERR
ncbi:MAG: flagellar motor protein MotA, partial [Rhodospirillales bacterium]